MSTIEYCTLELRKQGPMGIGGFVVHVLQNINGQMISVQQFDLQLAGVNSNAPLAMSMGIDIMRERDWELVNLVEPKSGYYAGYQAVLKRKAGGEEKLYNHSSERAIGSALQEASLPPLILIPQSEFLAQPSNKIELINGIVISIRLFEGGSVAPPMGKREYSEYFYQNDARFINWELILSHSRLEKPMHLKLYAAYYRVNGGLIGDDVIEIVIDEGIPWSNHTSGRGWVKPGNWQVGEYRIFLFFEKRKIASALFTITTS